MKGLKAGDQISYLTLQKPRYVKTGSKERVAWECRCVCGNIVTRRQDSLSPDKVMSCGCMHPMKMNREDQSPIWAGCGQLSGSFFTSIRSAAEYRDIPFEITIEEAWDLFVRQDGKCALTGEELAFAGQRARRRGVEQTASLDRIDSSGGYTLNNVWWVHKDVNMMKKEYPMKRFLEVCRKVAETHPSPDMQTAA